MTTPQQPNSGEPYGQQPTPQGYGQQPGQQPYSPAPGQQPGGGQWGQPWPAGGPGRQPGGEQDQAADEHRRKVRRAGIIIGVVALILIVIGLLATFGVFRGGGGPSSAPSLDRTDPNAVAAAFLQRYAVHDPSVCGLVAPSLQPRFTSDGRCSGSAGGAATVTVIMKAIVCGNRAGYAAQVSPPGQLVEPYASVGLELDGTTWSVRSLLPLSDRSVIQPYNCASSGNYGG